MNFRTLLLGTAAIVAAGSAQAADLAIAVEPIDYVKVCDAFGEGYWYIPGTDTCLKIGGYVRLDVWIYDTDRVGNYFNVADQLTGSVSPTADPSNPLAQTSGVVAGYLYAQDAYSQAWEMKTKAVAKWNSRSMSDLGVIATSFDFAVESDNNELEGTARTVYFDGGYGAIGPVMFGWTDSTFDPGGAFTYDADVRSDKMVDQVRFSYMMGSWGIMLGLEDPRDRYSGPTNATGNYPDIVLAVTGAVGGLDLRGAVAVTDRTSGTGWGANLAATAKLGVVDIKGVVSYSDNAKSYTGGSNCSSTLSVNAAGNAAWNGCDDGQWWSGFLSAAVALSGNLSAAGTVAYQDGPDSNDAEFVAAGGLYYYPSKASEIGAELLYSDPQDGDSEFGAHLRFETHFN
jgi:hypothetical protein